MKTISAIAAAALLLSVGAVSAQTPSSGASQPGSTTNTDKEVPAKGVPADKNTGAMGTSGAASAPSTSGAASGTTGGSNPNPASNKNPDSEVPGKKQ
jgi:hypothetical protein